jgi:hypothetical protein
VSVQALAARSDRRYAFRMTIPAARGRELAVATLGAATGLALALAAAPLAASSWAFVRRGFEATLFAYFLC